MEILRDQGILCHVPKTEQVLMLPYLPNLPAELKLMILRYLDQNALFMICRTCRVLWQVAVPLAYHRISLHLGQGRPYRYRLLISGNNPGVQHIRHVETKFVTPKLFNDEEAMEHGYPLFWPNGMENSILHEFLSSVPKDRLLSFTCNSRLPPYTKIWTKILVRLLKTQRNLERLELPAITECVSEHFGGIDLQGVMHDALAAKTQLKRLQSLTIGANPSPKFFRDWTSIVRNAPQLKALHLVYSSWRFNNEWHPGVDAGFVDAPLLFNSVTRLSLHSFPFPQLNFASLYGMTFPLVKTLELHECDREYLLLGIINLRTFPSLTAFLLKTKGLLFSHAVDSFLAIRPGLREIYLDLNTNNMPNVAAITIHGKTLHTLFVRCHYATSELRYSHREVNTVCSGCPELQHLAVTLPGMFMVDTEPKTLDSRDVDPYLGAFSLLRRARTLSFRCIVPIRCMWLNDTHDDIMDIALNELEAFISQQFFNTLQEMYSASKVRDSLETVAMSLQLHLPLSLWNGKDAPGRLRKGLATTHRHICQEYLDNFSLEIMRDMFVKQYAADEFAIFDAFVESMMLPSTRIFK